MNDEMRWRVMRDETDGGLLVIDQNSRVVCSLLGEPTLEMRQDAQLLAAAPLLLKAVRTALDGLDGVMIETARLELLALAHFLATKPVQPE